MRQPLASALLIDIGGAVRHVPGPGISGGGSGDRAPAGERPPAAPAPASDVVDPMSVTAILFDRLSTEARPAARRAALAYVDSLAPVDDYVGVFMADLSLRVFSPFTSERKVLHQAIDSMAQTLPANLRPEAPDPTIAPLIAETPRTAAAESARGFAGVEQRMHTGPTTPDPNNLRSSTFVQMLLRMERSYRAMLDEANGQASIAGLNAVVEALGPLPGRKTILYFSEALPVTARIKPLLDALIMKANSASVTIHPIDAAGLRVHSQEAAVGRELSVAGAQGVGDVPRDDGPWTRDLERQEQAVSSRAAAVLGRLARETGGFLVSDTNDLSKGIPLMARDRQTYYLLGYQSTNALLDGTFRRIDVKVKRPRVTVRARRGYFGSASTPDSR